MTIARLTLTCQSCKSVVRVERVIRPLVHGSPTYCVFCGAAQIGVTQDSELDKDEVLAEAFNLSVSNFQKLYQLWTLLGQGQSETTFRKFVENIRAKQQQK